MPTQVTPIIYADQYDGTNGAAIAAAMLNATVDSDDGTTLVISVGGVTFSLNVTDWIVYAASSVYTNVIFVGPDSIYTGLYA
jgi:hypothetical protein